MELSLSIDPGTGAIALGSGIRLDPFERQGRIASKVDAMIERSLNHGNGFEWLYLGGISFGGRSGSLALCFHGGQLEQVEWSLLDADGRVGWPTRQAIDEEIRFVRRLLAGQGLDVEAGTRTLAWGEVWSLYDSRGDRASSGLRYARR